MIMQLPAHRSSQAAASRAPPPTAGHALPTVLRNGIESLSGMDMGNVRVHYGSPLPARLNARAYAQGRNIHLAHGEEKHLPHEAWHVVQQMQGKVRPTTRVEGVGVNDDASLEREADRMGSRALQMKPAIPASSPASERAATAAAEGVAQLTVLKQAAGRWYSDYDPYTVFPTQAQAAAHDKTIKVLAGAKRRHYRVPTLYTYTHTKPANKLSRAVQGPHVVAHRLTLKALQDATTLAELKKIEDDQVLTPNDVNNVVMTDEAPGAGYSSQMLPRVTRYVAAYTKVHKSLHVEFKKKPKNLLRAKHRLNKLLNLDPYATYGWKSLAKASQAHTKGKGENVAVPTFADLMDKPPGGSISDPAGLQSFLDAREELFDDTFP